MAFRNGVASCRLCDSGGTTPGSGLSPLDRRIVFATVTAPINPNVDVSGPAGDNNLDTDLGDLSTAAFLAGYDIFLNGNRQTSGSGAGSGRDVYPGTSLALGQLRFEKKLKVGDVITLIDLDG